MDAATELIVRGHVEAAREKLAAAAALRREGFYADAVSRAYYASYHAAMAVLSALGLAPRSHEGLRSLFGARLVRTGRIAREIAKSLRLLHDERENGDYATGVEWDAADAEGAISRAEALVAECIRVLQEDTGRGW